MKRWGIRISLTILLMLPVSTWAAPQQRTDQCGVTNPGACTDAMLYHALAGVAGTIWSIDRMLLVLAYQVDHLRWWLTSTAFVTLYDGVRAIALPLLVPLAGLALTLGLLLFLVVPLFGRIASISLIQVVVWVVIAPLLLSEAGSWLLSLEVWRSESNGVLTNQIQRLTTQGLFGAAGVSTDEPIGALTPLYPAAGTASPCASVPISRPSGGSTPTTPAESPALQMDDLAAAFLLADARDIHCPGEQPTSHPSTLPMGFYGPFAAETTQIDTLTPEQRAQAIRLMQQGITRLLLGIVACLLAVSQFVIHLLFALSLIVLWLFLPIVVLLVLFSSTLRPLGALLQRVVEVLLSAWMITILMGLILACLYGAAKTGSAMALIALSVGGLFVMGHLIGIAMQTLTTTLQDAANLTRGAVGGLGAPSRVSTRNIGQGLHDTAELVESVVHGGLRTAVVTGMAAHATGNSRYTLGTALGMIRPVAPVGAVAASMGLLGEELATGLYAGERAQRQGISTYARQLRSDRQRPLSDGTTIPGRARMRAIQRQLDQAEPLPPDHSRNNHALDDMAVAGEVLLQGMHRARSQMAQGSSPDASSATPSGTLPTRTADTMRQPPRSDQQRPQSGYAMRADAHGRVRWEDALPPADATWVDRTAVRNRAGVLAAGYTMQEQPNGQVAIWGGMSGHSPSSEQRRAALTKAGWIVAAPTIGRPAPPLYQPPVATPLPVAGAAPVSIPTAQPSAHVDRNEHPALLPSMNAATLPGGSMGVAVPPTEADARPNSTPPLDRHQQPRAFERPDATPLVRTPPASGLPAAALRPDMPNSTGQHTLPVPAPSNPSTTIPTPGQRRIRRRSGGSTP